MRIIPRGARLWPAEGVNLAPAGVKQLYDDGFVGAWRDPDADAEFHALITETGGTALGEDVVNQYGLYGLGEGKLSLLFPTADKVFPGCMPGPAQQRGDCFVSGTIVGGPNPKPIEDVRVGDTVWNAFGKPTRVVSAERKWTDLGLFRITPRGGTPIVCTSDHRILASRGHSHLGPNVWVNANDLRHSDFLLQPKIGAEAKPQHAYSNGEFWAHAVDRIEYVGDQYEEPTVVYDVGVEDAHHSFLANGVAVHNCVSHGTKNAILMSLAVEVFNAVPDEVTGLVEGVPELTQQAIQQGALSTEWIYWWRAHGGDGWSCGAAASVAVKRGIMLRKKYDDLGIDLTTYSGGLAGKYGSSSPPENMAKAGAEHLVRTATSLKNLDSVRDILAAGYGVSHCGSEGWSNRRDENGFSERSGSWSHAMAYIGYDDRDIIKQKYGEPLILILNSWGATWIGGGRTILGTNIQIPEGSFWAKVSACRNRDAHAFSSINGWPRKKLVDLGWSAV